MLTNAECEYVCSVHSLDRSIGIEEITNEIEIDAFEKLAYGERHQIRELDFYSEHFLFGFHSHLTLSNAHFQR